MTALATVLQGSAGGSFGLPALLDGVREGTIGRATRWIGKQVADRLEVDELLAALRAHGDADGVMEVCRDWARPAKLVMLAAAIRLLRKSMRGELKDAIPHVGEGLPHELQVHALSHVFLVLKLWEDRSLFNVRKLTDPKVAAATVCWELSSIHRSVPWRTQHLLATTVTDAWEASVQNPAIFEQAWKKAAATVATRSPSDGELIENFLSDHQIGMFLGADELADVEKDIQFDPEDEAWRLRLTFRVEDEHSARRIDRHTRDLQLRLPHAMQDLIVIRILESP